MNLESKLVEIKCAYNKRLETKQEQRDRLSRVMAGETIPDGYFHLTELQSDDDIVRAEILAEKAEQEMPKIVYADSDCVMWMVGNGKLPPMVASNFVASQLTHGLRRKSYVGKWGPVAEGKPRKSL